MITPDATHVEPQPPRPDTARMVTHRAAGAAPHRSGCHARWASPADPDAPPRPLRRVPSGPSCVARACEGSQRPASAVHVVDRARLRPERPRIGIGKMLTGRSGTPAAQRVPRVPTREHDPAIPRRLLRPFKEHPAERAPEPASVPLLLGSMPRHRPWADGFQVTHVKLGDDPTHSASMSARASLESDGTNWERSAPAASASVGW